MLFLVVHSSAQHSTEKHLETGKRLTTAVSVVVQKDFVVLAGVVELEKPQSMKPNFSLFLVERSLFLVLSHGSLESLILAHWVPERFSEI